MQVARIKVLDRELVSLEAAYAQNVREMRAKLADDFAAVKAQKGDRLQALEDEQQAQQKPMEKWALGPLLARHEDEITKIHVELAGELRGIQDAHERLIEQLKQVRARDERRLHRRKEAVAHVVARMQAMQAENTHLAQLNASLTERALAAEYAAASRQKEASRLQARIRELEAREKSAAAERAAREAAERELAHDEGLRLAAEKREAQERESARQLEASMEASSFKSPLRMVRAAREPSPTLSAAVPYRHVSHALLSVPLLPPLLAAVDAVLRAAAALAAENERLRPISPRRLRRGPVRAAPHAHAQRRPQGEPRERREQHARADGTRPYEDELERGHDLGEPQARHGARKDQRATAPIRGAHGAAAHPALLGLARASHGVGGCSASQ